MITALLGYIYGVGFGLSLVGGTLYLIVLRGLKLRPNTIKFLLGVIFWPIGCSVVACKLYKMFKEDEHSRRNR